MGNGMIQICFVCLGNICRSPTAEAVMQSLIEEAGLEEHIEVDSAGTAAYHEGEAADARSREFAQRRGIHITSIARQFKVADFDRFDYVVTMDQSNLRNVLRLARNDADRAKVSMLRSFDEASSEGAEVPDPYYGGPGGFDEVLDICDAGCRGLLKRVRRAHGM